MGNYSATELDEWGRRIVAWWARTEMYSYVNNDWCAFAPTSALALGKRLHGGLCVIAVCQALDSLWEFTQAER